MIYAINNNINMKNNINIQYLYSTFNYVVMNDYKTIESVRLFSKTLSIIDTMRVK